MTGTLTPRQARGDRTVIVEGARQKSSYPYLPKKLFPGPFDCALPLAQGAYFYILIVAGNLHGNMAQEPLDRSTRGKELALQKIKEAQQQNGQHSQSIPGVKLAPVYPIKVTTAQLMKQTDTFSKKEPVQSKAVSIKLNAAAIPTVLANFTLADYQETGQYGPSADAGVGSTQILLGSKGRVRSFLKNGTVDNVLNIAHDRFFSSVSLGGFTADPNIIFDTFSKRWFLACNGAFPNLVLAMSNEDPVTTTTVWSFFIIDSILNPGFDAILPYFDYSMLGMDNNAIYLGVNIFDAANINYLSSAAYVVLKDSLLSGGPATVFAFRNLVNQVTFNGPFTLQPAQNFDPTATKGFFISENTIDVLLNSSKQLLLNTVTFQPSGPVLSAPISIAVTPFVGPLFASALGTPKPLFDVGVRLCPAHIRNGVLRVVHEIGVDNTGTSTPAITVTRNGARFYEINVNQPTPAVVNQGTLFQASATNDVNQRNFITPSIMSNSTGQVIIGATTCGTQERLNAAVAQIVNGVVGTPIVYTNSTANYFATEDWEFNPNSRWGDHTRVSIDPTDNTTFWPAQLWCSSKNTWASQIAHVQAG